MADTQRYWDGQKWTDHVAPGLPARSLAQEDEKRSAGLITAGIIMMIIFPIGGFIAGCVLLGRRAGVGATIMLLSFASAFVWYGLLYQAHQQTQHDQCVIDNANRAIAGEPLQDCG